MDLCPSHFRSFSFLLLFIGIGFCSHGQTIRNKTVANSFQNAPSGKVKLHWSVGEIAVKKIGGEGGVLAPSSSYVNASSPPIVTSTTSQLFLANVKLYPNPAHSYLTVEHQQPVHIRVVDLIGTEVYHQKFVGKTIDVSQLPSGIYIIHLYDDFGNVNTFKISKI